MTIEERLKLQEIVEMLNFRGDQGVNATYVLEKACEARLELIRLAEGIREAKA